MKDYVNRIIIYIVACSVLLVLLWVVNSGILIREVIELEDEIQVLSEPLNPKDGNTQIASRQKMLLLYSADAYSIKLKENYEKTCRWMKIDTEAVPAKRSDSVSYMDYDMVAIVTSRTEELLGEDLPRLFHYVETGGKLLWATMPSEIGNGFELIYRKLGILTIGDYLEFSEYAFIGELIPGIKNLSMEEEGFYDVTMSHRLEERCEVYLESVKDHIPLVWAYDYGEGRVTFCNMTVQNDVYTGLMGGCILTLQDTFLYPVINAKLVFIDDFPSMQYNSSSDIIKEEYNRTVKEFYRDIWWPDMQSAANKYGIKYTGVFMATYDNAVHPEQFSYVKDAMEQYYGNSLMKNGFEMGAHGYNHQSLTLAGGTPEEMEYEPWESIRDMKSSLVKLQEITEELFGAVKLYTYVPPSNYLSAEGRMAVVEAMEQLKIISGVYTGEGETGDVYVQEFRIAQDGIAEFPRMTSGMLDNEYENFTMLGAAGLYGVFSHFIHPDDILDAERGAGLTWQKLFDNFAEKLDLLNKRYEHLQPLTAAEAADALKIAYYAEVDYEVTGNRLQGKVYNYYGEGCFYLKTEQEPKAMNGCTVVALNSLYEGDIYLVKVTQPEFSISLH